MTSPPPPSAALSAAWPDAVESFVYGESAEGRPLRALCVSRSGARSARELHARNIPILFLQAGIHPGVFADTFMNAPSPGIIAAAIKNQDNDAYALVQADSWLTRLAGAGLTDEVGKAGGRGMPDGTGVSDPADYEAFIRSHVYKPEYLKLV